jgi:transcription termination factor Rho
MRRSMALRDEHLAVLHQRARELEVPGYRMLPRDELIEAIEERGGSGEQEPAPKEVAAPAAAAETRAVPEDGGGGEEAASEEVTGVLDRMPQGYGFLRLSGLHEAEGDVYVSASQIRRCELRPGDEVGGPARPPRRGERHRALVRVESVNGQSPEEERRSFEDLTPAPPHRRLLAPG